MKTCPTYTSESHFPITGERGNLYISSLSNKLYTWDGVCYIEISNKINSGAVTVKQRELLNPAKLDEWEFWEWLQGASVEELETFGVTGTLLYCASGGGRSRITNIIV